MMYLSVEVGVKGYSVCNTCMCGYPFGVMCIQMVYSTHSISIQNADIKYTSCCFRKCGMIQCAFVTLYNPYLSLCFSTCWCKASKHHGPDLN